MSATLRERCTADGWSAETIGCMASAPEAEMQACSDHLTADQKDRFIAAVGKAMGAGGDDSPPANEFDNPCGE